MRLDVEQAVPLGLLLHELPHPPPGQRLALRLALQPAAPAALVLEVQDNGPGFDPAAPARPGAFGQRLVAALARQLGGQLMVEAEGATFYRLVVGG